MKIFKIHSMSIPAAILLGAVIIGLSVFLTTLVFFGGEINRQKLFIKAPTPAQRNVPPALTPEQVKKMQEQRAAQANKQAPATTTDSE